LVETELQIKRKLRRSRVIHADETGLRVEKRGHYIHVASTPHLTHYACDSRRGKAAMDEIGILPSYRGNLVHDGWWSYDAYTNCQHCLCGAHLLRELTFFSELSSEQKEWAGPLKQLLLEIKARVEQVRENGSRDLNSTEQEAFIERYDRLVKQGLEGNRPLASSALLEEEIGSRAAICQRQAHNLLLRMECKKEQVLRFMRDFTVGFDNNQAERDFSLNSRAS
jgi:transposase